MDALIDTVTAPFDWLIHLAVTVHSLIYRLFDFIGPAGFCGLLLGAAIGSIGLSASLGPELAEWISSRRRDRRR